MNVDQHYERIIRNLGLMNQYLIGCSLSLGLTDDVKELKRLDSHLHWLLEYKGFNFIAQIASGKTLFVGEGNLSFATSLLGRKGIISDNITATTFEIESELSEKGRNNAQFLSSAGARVLYNVDATKLTNSFGSEIFDNIVFQFPHVGSREPIRGRNPNFVLVGDFLKSAAKQLNPNGTVMISAVDSPHYDGAFSFGEAANLAGFNPPNSYKFNPSQFSGYEHTMTNEDESALEGHKDFKTWVFKLKCN